MSQQHFLRTCTCTQTCIQIHTVQYSVRVQYTLRLYLYEGKCVRCTYMYVVKVTSTHSLHVVCIQTGLNVQCLWHKWLDVLHVRVYIVYTVY